MTRTAFVFDRSRETALARARLITQALAAAAPGAWRVEPVSSRNRLLADIARSDERSRSIALIDLADNERNIAWRLGDRIIATIATHPNLRARCTPVALTAYGERDVANAIQGVGGFGLIDATELLVAIDAEAAQIGRVLTGLADTTVRRSFVRWPGQPLPVLDSTEAEAQIAQEFQRWFAKRFEAWQLEALAGLATGHSPSRIAAELVELGLQPTQQTAAKRVSELNRALTVRGPGPTLTETASRFLTQVAYLRLPGPSSARYPNLETAETWFIENGLTRAAAWMHPDDEPIFNAVRHQHRQLAPERRPGNREAGQHDRRIIDACRAAAAHGDWPTLRVLASTERTLQALHDAHADYAENPHVLLGHTLREIERQPVLRRWWDRIGCGGDAPIVLFEDPPIALDARARITLGERDADAWETGTERPRPCATEAALRLADNLAAVLAAAERCAR